MINLKKLIKVCDSIRQYNKVKDRQDKYLPQSAKDLKQELGLAKRTIGSHQSKGIREYHSRQNQFNNKDVAEINEAINDAIYYLDQGFGEESYYRLQLNLERIENVMPSDTNSEEYKVLQRVLKKGYKAIDEIKKYLKSN